MSVFSVFGCCDGWARTSVWPIPCVCVFAFTSLLSFSSSSSFFLLALLLVILFRGWRSVVSRHDSSAERTLHSVNGLSVYFCVWRECVNTMWNVVPVTHTLNGHRSLVVDKNKPREAPARSTNSNSSSQLPAPAGGNNQNQQQPPPDLVCCLALKCLFSSVMGNTLNQCLLYVIRLSTCCFWFNFNLTVIYFLIPQLLKGLHNFFCTSCIVQNTCSSTAVHTCSCLHLIKLD